MRLSRRTQGKHCDLLPRSCSSCRRPSGISRCIGTPRLVWPPNDILRTGTSTRISGSWMICLAGRVWSEMDLSWSLFWWIQSQIDSRTLLGCLWRTRCTVGRCKGRIGSSQRREKRNRISTERKRTRCSCKSCSLWVRSFFGRTLFRGWIAKVLGI